MLTGLPCTSVNSLSFQQVKLFYTWASCFIIINFSQEFVLHFELFSEILQCTLKHVVDISAQHCHHKQTIKKTHTQTHNKQKMQIPLSLTTFTNVFFFRVCSSEAASGQLTGGAEEAAGGGAKHEVMS